MSWFHVQINKIKTTQAHSALWTLGLGMPKEDEIARLYFLLLSCAHSARSDSNQLNWPAKLN